ncbi:MAG: hypothetical protein OXG97_08085 [Candidatus Poribacteria bacterium]|nr:hypothetical protein [Candidatus Poribacteria bacterium]
MNLNCKQTLNNLPHLVLNGETRTAEPTSEGISRRTLLEHLRTCPGCQREYEALWHTASVLETTEAPVPPPELVGNIQRSVRQLHRQQQLAFFAGPLAWCLDRLKVDLSPRFVNAVVLLFFLVASGFVMKLAFFTESQEPELGLTAMERTRLEHVKISPSPWALVKDTETKVGNLGTPKQPVIAVQHARDYFFSPTQDASKMWPTDTVDYEEQTGEASVVSYSQNVGSQKLTVFWNHIKTEL